MTQSNLITIKLLCQKCWLQDAMLRAIFEQSPKLSYSMRILKFKSWKLSSNYSNYVPKTLLSYIILFYNILSACHYSDVINSLFNAFRLKKPLKTYILLWYIIRYQWWVRAELARAIAEVFSARLGSARDLFQFSSKLKIGQKHPLCYIDASK